MSVDPAPSRRKPARACELRGSTRLLHELFSWTYSIPGASFLSFQGVGSLGTMTGVPGSPGTNLLAMLCPMGSRWRAARRTRGSHWVSLPEPTGTGPQIPGSLPAGVEPAASDACWAPLGWIVCKDRSLWTEGFVRRENPQRRRLGKLRRPLNKLRRWETLAGK